MDEDFKELMKKSLFIIREARAQFKKPAVLWSTGKDSTVMLALIKEAFFGKFLPAALDAISNGTFLFS